MFEIGATLRQARERRGLGLDQAEAETKVRARYLRALEDEHFDVLPGPTYVKGFLRTYAEYLGLDGRLFVDEYNSRHLDPFTEELMFPRSTRARARNGRRGRRERRVSNVAILTLAAIVAVTVMLTIAIAWSSPGGGGGPATNVPTVPKIQPSVNPQLTPTTSAPALALPPTPKPVKLIAKAVGGACDVGIWEGSRASGPPAYEVVLDPAAADRGISKTFVSAKGFVVRVGAPGNLQLVVNGSVRILGTGSLFAVLPNGAVRELHA